MKVQTIQVGGMEATRFRPLAGKWSMKGRFRLTSTYPKLPFPSPCGEMVNESFVPDTIAASSDGFRPLAGKWSMKGSGKCSNYLWHR